MSYLNTKAFYTMSKMIQLGRLSLQCIVWNGRYNSYEPAVKVVTFSPSSMLPRRLPRGAIKVLIIALPATDRQPHRHLPE